MIEDCENRPKTDCGKGACARKNTPAIPVARKQAFYPRGYSLWIGCPSTNTGLALPCLASLLELQDVASLGREMSGSERMRGSRSIPFQKVGVLINLRLLQVIQFDLAFHPVTINRLVLQLKVSSYHGIVPFQIVPQPFV